MIKKNTIFVLAAIAILVIVGVGLSIWQSKKMPAANLQKADGIEIFEPTANKKITSPLKITGKVSGSGWTGFEGQVGTVRLFDSNNKELALGILTATTDWMQLPTEFETNLYFDYPGDGVGKLVFHNENASGEAERNRTFELPVMLSKSSAEKSKVKVYFINDKAQNNLSCDLLFYAEREIPKTQALAKAALEELLKGPSNTEKMAGFSTNINPGVVLKSIVIENGVAKADFTDALQAGVAGSCKVTAIRAQITQTLKQFSTVKSVVISINGQSENILQP